MRLGKRTLFILFVLSVLMACQQETDILKLPPPAEAFISSSSIANLVNRTSLLDGSVDNILDSASCSSIMLPVVVWVNGQELTINSTEDLKYIERIIEESDTDDDEISIVFPVTVILPDYTTVEVPDTETLKDIMDQCLEGGSDDDIECVDFVYPVKFAVYNTTSQTSQVITINDDESMHHFMDNLKEEELVSFYFPVVMLLSDGSEVTVQDNDELEAAIESASNACDEDDDNDFDDDDVDTSALTAVLITGTWKVTYFFDDTDQTALFGVYSFVFNADGSANAFDGVTSIDGTWNIYGNDGTLELELDFGESMPFDKIDEDWNIFEYTDTIISLQGELSEVPVRKLTFEKI